MNGFNRVCPSGNHMVIDRDEKKPITHCDNCDDGIFKGEDQLEVEINGQEYICCSGVCVNRLVEEKLEKESNKEREG